MSVFLDQMKSIAQSHPQTIVLPEGEDPRTIEAAHQIIREKLANIVILGDPRQVTVAGAQVIDPTSSDKRDAYAQQLVEIRKKKGLTLEQAYQLLDDPLYFGVMMVKAGDAQGMVAGACHSTADTLRPALQILKTAPGVKLVSSFFVMTVPHCSYGDQGVFIFSDCGLNEYPDANQLSEIAISSANSWKALMDSEPHIAMLSYSSHGSASSEHVDKVSEATKLVQQKAPHLVIDGELQFDAAIVPAVAASKAKGSPVAGHANVIIFPNLDAGNIGYKIAQRLAGAEAYGPILQGIAAPVNDLSRGCSAEDIVGVVAITAAQAQAMQSQTHHDVQSAPRGAAIIDALKPLMDKISE